MPINKYSYLRILFIFTLYGIFQCITSSPLELQIHPNQEIAKDLKTLKREYKYINSNQTIPENNNFASTVLIQSTKNQQTSIKLDKVCQLKPTQISKTNYLELLDEKTLNDNKPVQQLGQYAIIFKLQQINQLIDLHDMVEYGSKGFIIASAQGFKQYRLMKNQNDSISMHLVITKSVLEETGKQLNIGKFIKSGNQLMYLTDLQIFQLQFESKQENSENLVLLRKLHWNKINTQGSGTQLEQAMNTQQISCFSINSNVIFISTSQGLFSINSSSTNSSQTHHLIYDQSGNFLDLFLMSKTQEKQYIAIDRQQGLFTFSLVQPSNLNITATFFKPFGNTSSIDYSACIQMQFDSVTHSLYLLCPHVVQLLLNYEPSPTYQVIASFIFPDFYVSSIFLTHSALILLGSNKVAVINTCNQNKQRVYAGLQEVRYGFTPLKGITKKLISLVNPVNAHEVLYLSSQGTQLTLWKINHLNYQLKCRVDSQNRNIKKEHDSGISGFISIDQPCKKISQGQVLQCCHSQMSLNLQILPVQNLWLKNIYQNFLLLKAQIIIIFGILILLLAIVVYQKRRIQSQYAELIEEGADSVKVKNLHLKEQTQQSINMGQNQPRKNTFMHEIVENDPK